MPPTSGSAGGVGRHAARRPRGARPAPNARPSPAVARGARPGLPVARLEPGLLVLVRLRHHPPARRVVRGLGGQARPPQRPGLGRRAGEPDPRAA